MIGYVQGKVLFSDGKKALVLTNQGVGYDLNYGYFLQADTIIGLYTHHHITDSDQSLWAFNNIEDKRMFELLKTVNKVGSSKAYPLVTNIGRDELIEAIRLEQVSVLTKSPGIGKKVAEQIILSLKDKIGQHFSFSSEAEAGEGSDVTQIGATEKPAIYSNKKLVVEARMALESLGYKDIDLAIQSCLDETVQSSEELIKRVLKEL
jgi:Holliday junction DNA helicase RuvA